MTRPDPIRYVPSIGVTLNPNECVPGEQHEMLSIKLAEGNPVGYIERCHRCGWIDESSLNWWVEDAIKKSMTERAQRIAISAETQPFAFVQQTGQDLTLQEILFQALGAASVCWVGGTGDLVFDSSRAKAVGEALVREVNRALNMASEPWADLAYQMYALSCNSTTLDAAKAEEWQGAFERLKARFHELLEMQHPNQDKVPAPIG